ncbi:MAG: hypothetical protein AB1782_10930 [Cyanobacteriota bacterium]
MRNTFALFLILISFLAFNFPVKAEQNNNKTSRKQLPPLTGGIQENDFLKGSSQPGERPTGFIKDSLTGDPISNAEVSIPDKGLSTQSKQDGSFNLNLNGENGNFILSVKKDGYLPYALNVKKGSLDNPFNLHIEKQSGQLIVDSDIHHLGDNNYSLNSANAGAFRLPSEGPTFIKEFYLESLPPNGMILKIGSIIGLDTIASQQLGQSQISAYSTPLSIFVNSVKIAEISVNADNKTIPIHNGVLKPHSKNLLVFQTGVNQVVGIAGQMDYDDIEFIHILLEKTK